MKSKTEELKSFSRINGLKKVNLSVPQALPFQIPNAGSLFPMPQLQMQPNFFTNALAMQAMQGLAGLGAGIQKDVAAGQQRGLPVSSKYFLIQK